MERISNFLTDSKQSKLRKLSQVQTERFEHTIESYKKLFLLHFQSFKESSENTINSKGKTEDEDVIFKIKIEIEQQIKENLKNISVDKIELFFDKLKEIYELWMKSKSVEAVKELDNLMEKFKLYSFNINISNLLLFRGRYGGKFSYNKYDMFHVPYDKRYLIANQRYSLQGIPFLYLGTSIYDVAKEMDVDFRENPVDNIYFSYFFLRKYPYEIYDLSNPFYKKVAVEETIAQRLENRKIGLEEVENNFFKFILSSVCSFEKKNKESDIKFHEEYILPQILTQTLILKNFKGIFYPSTKINENCMEENNYLYRNNIALFTEYVEDRHYDVNLYKSCEICHPVKKKNALDECSIDIKIIENIINELLEQEIELNIKKICIDFLEKFTKLKIEDKKNKGNYLEHETGKLHIFMFYNFLMLKKSELISGRLE